MAHTVLLFSWQQLYGEISWCLREVFTGTFSLTFWGWFGVRISERNVRASFLRWPEEAKQSSSAVLLRRGLRWWQERCSVLFQIKLYLHFDAFDVLTAEKTAFMEALAITLHFLRVVNRPVACCTLVASAPIWHGVSDKTQRWWERLNISSVPPLNFQTRVSKKRTAVFSVILKHCRIYITIAMIRLKITATGHNVYPNCINKVSLDKRAD